MGQKCGIFGSKHPGVRGEEFFWGENVGILVKAVGILMKTLGFSKLGHHESAWELWDFCGKYGNFGGKMMEFGSKMWEFWGSAPRSPWGEVLFGGKCGNFG